MDVNVIQSQDLVTISEHSVSALANEFIHFHDVLFDEVAIHFVDTPAICDLHRRFFDDPSPTDCISFPMDDAEEDGYKIMGDVFVCPETAQKYIALHGGDLYKETTLYVVHGLLHLLGYDDLTESEALEMRKAEAQYLEHVDKKKLWLKK